MKLYHFHDPYDFHFAQASRRGTWYPKGATVCPECGSSRQTRISLLILEWEPGSDEIGDFVCAGADELVVTQKVRDSFEGRFQEIEFGPVEFWQEPKLKQPKKMTRQSKSRVWLPLLGLGLLYSPISLLQMTVLDSYNIASLALGITLLVINSILFVALWVVPQNKASG